MLVGKTGAVKELDGGVGNGVGTISDGAGYGSQNGWGGRKGQVDSLLLGALDLEIGAIRQAIKVLLNVGHNYDYLLNDR